MRSSETREKQLRGPDAETPTSVDPGGGFFFLGRATEDEGKIPTMTINMSRRHSGGHV